MKSAARLPIALAASLALLALVSFHAPAPAEAIHTPVDVAIDVDVTGNTGTSLGPTESCNTTPIQVGDTFEIDIVVRGVPPWEPVGGSQGSHGIRLADFELMFDRAKLYAEDLLGPNGPTLFLTDDFQFFIVDYRDGRIESPFEDSIGGVSPRAGLAVSWVSFDQPPLPSGDGIVTRVRMKALTEGVFPMTLRAPHAEYPLLGGGENLEYPVIVQDAKITVGDHACSDSEDPVPTVAPTPTPTPPTPSPTAMPSPTPTPVVTPTVEPTDVIPGDGDGGFSGGGGDDAADGATATITPAALPAAGGARSGPATEGALAALGVAMVVMGGAVAFARRRG